MHRKEGNRKFLQAQIEDKEVEIFSQPKTLSKMETKYVARRHSIGSLQRRRMCKLKRKNSERKLSRSIEKIRADMVEISEGQKRIRQGQLEVREKFEEISVEAAKLKEETNQICKQSAANQLRLDLMFQIVKARSRERFCQGCLSHSKITGSNGEAEHDQNPGCLASTHIIQYCCTL
uniref:Uncharacterized protein n=1 Tax=Salix viminalis TaxID=40686 RepID=A0A6N2M565_SALVM